MLSGKRITFVGGGNMSEALIGGLLRTARARPTLLLATDVLPDRREFLATHFEIGTSNDNRAAVEQADIVVLSVEPQVLDGVLAEIRPVIGLRHLVVSVAAGYPISRISQGLSACKGIVRAMPNTPSIIGQGVTAVSGSANLSAEDQGLVQALFESVGAVVMIEERLMDAVTGLSGSGPAYVYMMIEALADGGVRVGLPRQTAALLAVHTVAGAASMLLSGQDHPAVLKDRVASPGGTTIAGLRALEQGHLRGTLLSTVVAATRRSSQLGLSPTSSGENQSCNTG